MATDYYGVLGVSPEASTEEIRNAFRTLAREHHPDATGGDPASEHRYKEVSEAYAVDPTAVFVLGVERGLALLESLPGVDGVLNAVALETDHVHELLLAGPGVAMGRVKGVAQAEYDFAQKALAFTGIKRLSLRGLFSLSQAGTDEGGGALRNDRVQLSRLELRFAPTATESAYALFRSSTVSRQPSFADVFSVASRRWELNSGVRSAIVSRG